MKAIIHNIIKVLKYWKPGFNDEFSFLPLVLKQQESAIHGFCGYYYVHDALNFYHRPYHDYNSVTCVYPKDYALFVASQTYVSGYNWDFVVHMFKKKTKTKQNYVVYRQEMNIFTIIISTHLKVTIIISIYFLLIYISIEMTSKPYSWTWCLQFTLTNVQYKLIQLLLLNINVRW